jgi:hypothetical protein
VSGWRVFINSCMQRFIAELSSAIEKDEFDSSWRSQATGRAELKVEFAFDGRRVSATIHSDADSPWESQSFRRAFSTVIRRINASCNVRWI